MKIERYICIASSKPLPLLQVISILFNELVSTQDPLSAIEKLHCVRLNKKSSGQTAKSIIVEEGYVSE